MTGSWVQCLGARPAAQVRLVCFPHAGGSPVAFRAWPQLLPEWIEVHAVLLPGRMARLRESPVSDWSELLAALSPAVLALADRPLALLGHSLGALLAFETARALSRQPGLPPLALFALGARAPHRPHTDRSLRALPEPEFWQAVAGLGGTPPEVLAHDELRRLVLPVLRADLTLAETYMYAAEPPLGCPILALGGAHDPRVSPADLDEWSAQTTGAFQKHLFLGGHFFLQEREAEVTSVIAGALAA